jgi:hypothetical protein
MIGFTEHVNRVEIMESNPYTVQMQVEFSSFNKRMNQPITRFLFAQTQPSFTYQVSEVDHATVRKDAQVTNTAPIQIGKPILIKNCLVYPIIVWPNYLKENIITSYKSLDITLNYLPPIEDLILAPSLEKAYAPLFLNLKDSEESEPLGFLIICPDAFYDSVLPLAQWKEKKGWHVSVKCLSETGSTPTDIKNYIANAYYTWSPPPEYVLLIGDVNQLHPAATNIPVSTTDYPYSLIDGDDFLAELLIGRLPANTTNELSTIVAKIIGYETTPYMNDSSWFTRALMVAANYPHDTMTTPIATKRWVRDRFYEYGYNTVDTVYFPPISGATEITNSVNQGVSFVNYRGGIADPDGWVYPNFHNPDVIGLSNGWKLPVVTSITCLNGNFGYETCFGEAWVRAGNPITPKGGVAFFGASAAITSSRWNNCLDMGIYWGILEEHIYNLGPALYRGKMEVYANFPGDTAWASGSSFYFHTYNLLGDPSLDVWTDIPDTFIVTHASMMPVGSNYITIQVLNSSAQPVGSAMVSLYKDNEVKEVTFTNASGNADLNFATSNADTLFVTVTKHNFKPYLGHCLINTSSVYVGYDSHLIDDSGGNNNGEVNPGEPIAITITLRNFGNSTTATNVSAKLTTSDPLITITDSIQSYGSIAPGATANASPFDFNVSTNAKHNHVAKFNLEITSSEGTWNSSIWLGIQAPDLVYQWNQILDGGNNVLEPGETSDLIISLRNSGGLAGNNISGILRSRNPGVSIIDSIGTFGNIQIDDSSTNNSNHFRVSAAASLAPGHTIGFTTVLSGNNNFRDTIDFEIIIGIVSSSEPSGPDEYGYFAYDNTDAGYAERPTYTWIEIDPELGGPGDTLHLEKDETKTVSLPFSFKFYGNTYNRISICSNGYIAMDSTWIADMYNWRIPAAGGPPLLIAPFWDDLDPNATDSSGSVCYWFDSSNHQFIVEYSRVQHIHDPTNPTPAELQTFEVILFDPAHYPTVSGDGEILFQYKDITNDDIWHNYATTGIENKEHTIGLEYTFDNMYDAGAAVLANDRAIKFTTDPPDTFPGITESSRTGDYFKIELYPNPFCKQINIRFGKELSVPSKGDENPRLSDGTKGTVLRIYDVSGRVIKNLELPTAYSLLPTSVSWSGTNDLGKKVAAGVYFIHLETEGFHTIEKIVFLK